MTDAAATTRRARALLDVAEQAGQAEQVADELDVVATAMAGDAVAARVLLNPVVAPVHKVEAVTALGSRAGLTRTVAKLLVVLAEHDALATLPALAASYRARLLERRNIVAVDVTTAEPLAGAQAGAIARRLGEVTGKQVQLSTRVDPSIVGGVVARIGGTIYDGSITTQLARMRQKLVENV